MKRQYASLTKALPSLSIAALLFLASSGCRDAPPQPVAKSKTAPAPVRPPERKHPEARPDRSKEVAARESGQGASGAKDGAAGQASGEEGQGEPGDHGGTPTGGTRAPGGVAGGAPYDGTRAPHTPEESIGIAGRELKSSGKAEASGDLPAAVRHAARALQAAQAFPRDPKCAALADAARGRLKTLEEKGITPGELSRGGSLDSRRIIESP